MTGTSIDTQAAVEAAKSVTGILPPAGKTAVVEHLLSGMTPEALKALSPEARAKLVVALSVAEAPSVKSLPAVPALTNEFQQLVQLTNGTLEARQGTHSAFEFRLTLKDVQPGQTQRTLEALVAEINERFPSMTNFPSCGFKVYLSKNGDLPNYQEAGSVVITCSSLITDSTNRHRNQTITLDDKQRISQEALLSQHGLVEVANDVVRVIAGMYRLAHGFPANKDDIGTDRDKGDVFEGEVARTKQGSSSGSAGSYQHGVHGNYWGDGDGAGVNVGVVGGLSPELKN